MPNINKDIEYYESIRNDLEAKNTSKWCLIHDQQLIDLFETFEEAAQKAVKLFGKGPYLIRQIGAPPIVLPASVAFFIGKHA
jgi:hypothetical protein